MAIVEDFSISPSLVWRAWVEAHGKGVLEEGAKGEIGHKKLRYQICDVVPNTSFSMVCKAFLVRLIFSYAVQPFGRGSRICYTCRIKGPFAWILRFFLQKKIDQNLELVLKDFVKKLKRS